MKKRIGIFGGTFNPPHIGHMQAAKAFAEAMKLDTLLIMPAYIPPHKGYNSTVTCEERLQMCRIAFDGVSKAQVSDLEILREGTSYTYITLQELTSPDAELFFLCGTDMILTMDSWKNPDIIFALANICYIRRENDENVTEAIASKCREYESFYNAHIYAIDSDVIEISSSEIRNNASARQQFLDAGVVEYIREKGLYR